MPEPGTYSQYGYGYPYTYAHDGYSPYIAAPDHVAKLYKREAEVKAEPSYRYQPSTGSR